MGSLNCSFAWGLFVAIIILSFSENYSVAADVPRFLNQGALFARCYSHFTGRRVPSAHPLLIDSIQKNNSENTINNCMKIFDKAQLAPQTLGPISAGYPSVSQLSNTQDLESIQVLNYFLANYIQYFEETDFENRPQTYSGRIDEWYDVSEDALFLLRATFEGSSVSSNGMYTNSFPYSQVLQSAKSLTGLRVLPTKVPLREGICDTYGSNCSWSPNFLANSISLRSYFDLPDWDYQSGRGSASGDGYLLGIKVWPEGHSTHYSANGSIIDVEGRTGKSFQRNRGGGILGTSSYLLKNGQYSDRKSGSESAGTLSWGVNQDGGVINRRRMIKNIYSSLLCRDQPPLRMDDDIVLERVSTYKQQNFDPSKVIAFRESQLCASCHVSYDEAAAVLRNTGITSGTFTNWDVNSDGKVGGNHDGTTFVFSNKIDGAKLAPPPHLTHPWNNNSWGYTKPTGRLVFRDFRGDVNNVELPAEHSSGLPQNKGIQELGEALSQTDQFYACMTKRLFYHFTGIQVSLEDHGDSRLPSLSASELHYRDQFIVPLAFGKSGKLGFKQHQSIRLLIKDMISSDIYRSVNLRDEVK